jgi:hypothetical protein
LWWKTAKTIPRIKKIIVTEEFSPIVVAVVATVHDIDIDIDIGGHDMTTVLTIDISCRNQSTGGSSYVLE